MAREYKIKFNTDGIKCKEVPVWVVLSEFNIFWSIVIKNRR